MNYIKIILLLHMFVSQALSASDNNSTVGKELYNIIDSASVLDSNLKKYSDFNNFLINELREKGRLSDESIVSAIKKIDLINNTKTDLSHLIGELKDGNKHDYHSSPALALPKLTQDISDSTRALKDNKREHYSSSPLSPRSIQNTADSMGSMGVSVSEARSILKATYILIKNIQYSFERIGSQRDEYSFKIGERGLINSIIAEYFSSPSAVVRVSLIEHNRIIEYTIYNYLHRLAHMSQNGVYRTIKLDFGKKIFIKDVYQASGEININADALQLFEGCKDTLEGRYCYSDVTKKTFIVKAINSGSGFSSYTSKISIMERPSHDRTNVIIE